MPAPAASAQVAAVPVTNCRRVISGSLLECFDGIILYLKNVVIPQGSQGVILSFSVRSPLAEED